jgi:glucose-1-phosphate thymidylyltransferase
VRVVDDRTRSESDRRGAIGDIDFVIRTRRVRTDLLIVGGDNLFDGTLKGFVERAAHHLKSPLIGVYDIKSRRKAAQYGVVKCDARGRVLDFSEKPTCPASSLVAMCLYYFPKGKLGMIARYLSDEGNARDATGFYIDWLRRSVDVYAYVFGGRWFDIGHMDFLRKAQKSFSVSR